MIPVSHLFRMPILDVYKVFFHFVGDEFSMKYLIEANKNGERITIFFMECCFGFVLATVVLGFMLILYCFITYGNFDANYLFLPYNYVCVTNSQNNVLLCTIHINEYIFTVSRDPWSHESLIGWSIEYTFQVISGGSYLLISMVFASFFICICLHHHSFSKQFRGLLNILEVEIKKFHDHHSKSQHKKIILLLCQLVQFHTSTKE